MTIPTGVQTVTVTFGQVLDQAGQEDWHGTITFTPTAPRRHVASGVTFSRTPFVMDVAGGQGSVVLVASDADGMTQGPVLYRVAVALQDRTGRPVDIQAVLLSLPAAQPVAHLELLQSADPTPPTLGVLPGVTSVAGLTGVVSGSDLAAAIGVLSLAGINVRTGPGLLGGGSITSDLLLQSDFGQGAGQVAQGSDLARFADGSVAATVPRPTSVDVRDFGAVGDGSHDDTAAIQAALNTSTLLAPKTIEFPTGKFRITAELTVPFAPYTRIIGAGRDATIIEQQTAGQPVFAFRQENIHSIYVADLTVQYSAAQTNTASVAFFYRVTGGATSGQYHHCYERVNVYWAYRGFGLAEGDGKQFLWDTTWRNVSFYGIKDRCISYAPTTASGQPNITLHSITVFNTGAYDVGATGTAFVLHAGDINFTGLDIEGWHNQVVEFLGGRFCVCRGFHIEHHVFDAASSRVIYCADGPFVLDGFILAGATTAGNTTAVTIAAFGNNGLVTLMNGTHGVDTTLGTASIKEVFWAGAGNATIAARVQDVIKTSGGLNQPNTGTRAAETAEYLTGVGMLPDGNGRGFFGQQLILADAGALPTATSALRGSIRTVRGGSGAADTTFQCLKAAAGTYSWVQIATG